jgi:hypothetical protein
VAPSSPVTLDSAEIFSTSRREAARIMLAIASALSLDRPIGGLLLSARGLHRD